MDNQQNKFDWRKEYSSRLTKDDIESCLFEYAAFANNESIPSNAKKVMAALICAYENTRASETGILCMDLKTLSRIAGMRDANFKISLKTLERLGIVKFSIGEKRNKGGKAGVASSFKIDFDALKNLSETASGQAGDALHYNTLHSITKHNILKHNTEVHYNSLQDNPQQLKTEQDSLENFTEDNNKTLQGNSEKDTEEHKNLSQLKPTKGIELKCIPLDEIKEKINEKGINSLTEEESNFYLKSINETVPVYSPIGI